MALLGWFGAGLYLLNHGWLALKQGHESPRYYLLNLLAAAAIVISSAAIGSWQAVLTNVFWVGVSAVVLVRGARPSGVAPAWLREGWVVTPVAIAIFTGLVLALARPCAGISTVGWAGTALFSVAYLMFAAGVIARPRFLAYNAIAAFALVPILFADANWPVFCLELVWGMISVFGWRSAQKRHPNSTTTLKGS